MPSLIENPSDSSGLSLAVRLQKDSAEAWQDLVVLYAPLVKSWATRCGVDDAAAEDIVQDVFMSVHRSIGQFDPAIKGATFQGWLWRITRNCLLQMWRKPGAVAQGGSTAQARVAAIAAPAEHDLSEHELSEHDPPSSAADCSALLRRAMHQIENRVESSTWQAFVRTTVHGEATEDVAADLGMTPAAVRKAKSRTLQRLRKQLGDQT